MARLIRHDRQRPYLIRQEDVDSFPVAVCACGLSATKPFCDGSHKLTTGEAEDAVYVYDQDQRVPIRNRY